MGYLINIFIVGFRMELGSWLSLTFVLSLSLPTIHCELYTALVEMEELLETEAVLMRALDGYIDAQERKLYLLRQ